MDEMHRVPGMFEYLRGIIDKGKREGKGKGRFLFVGSAQLNLLRQKGETLAGRMAIVNLAPLNVLEIEHGNDSVQRLWLRGGFPQSYLAGNDSDSQGVSQ